ncbi:MAG: DUF502 domain-containing protein [Gammaproteobacteria bacterium]|nr:MAG: DUF502 domain-containing protein [Gammaproteobacteria bacterium]
MRRYFVAGLLVWVPLGMTFLVIKAVVDVMDRTLLLLPAAYRPETLMGFTLPGLGVVLMLAVVFLTGMVVANFFGRKLISLWELILARIPLVRSIYSGVKQVMSTMLSGDGKSFRKVVMLEYPRKGTWTLAFLTGEGWAPAKEHTGEDLIHVYVPTTPNPTSGFFLMVPRKDIIELDISVDDGLKMIISTGVVTPEAVASKGYSGKFPETP